ncbi:glutamate racemase [Phaeocystidibacter luteus]|uniref:Glutamate racemase n=1 Tax=Phaeocystidibacter luteus TaxID=911197 RepID=A0A6N6RKN1_9FLAO|nr:glutamate racemase [Phaeocystidibacter luteus]
MNPLSETREGFFFPQTLVIPSYLHLVKNPIGIFDSGVGGLTVAKAIRELLPAEDIIYFGDTAHLPYGEKSSEAIKSYSLGIAEFLVASGAKAIVIACNSASSVATDVLKEKYEPKIPIINVIDPVVDAIPENTNTIGVIGTRATITSNVYQEKITGKSATLDIRAMATPLFVPVIEEGLESSEIARKTAEHYLGLESMKGIDTLIPGCTHYPLLTQLFRDILGADVQLMNTPVIVAEYAHHVLQEANLLNAEESLGTSKFFVSDYTPTFERISRHFFHDSIHLEEYELWK